jgi:hypothetical protein
MGTPTSAKYSRVPGTPQEALARLDEQLLPAIGLEYSEFGALQPSNHPLDQGFKLIGRLVPCRSLAEALNLARSQAAWATSFLSRQVPGNVDFYAVDIGKTSFGARLVVESSMPYYESDELPMGEWLVKLLLAAVSALGCDVCGYGADDAYEAGYDSLEPSVVLARLRAGELFKIRSPQFHAIATTLISEEEMRALLDNHPKDPTFVYKVSTTGYHVLYDVA